MTYTAVEFDQKSLWDLVRVCYSTRNSFTFLEWVSVEDSAYDGACVISVDRVRTCFI